MTPDKDTLQVQLNRFSNDRTHLQAGLAQLKQEIQQLHDQIAQKSAEIERQNGALAYNQVLSKSFEDQVAEADKAAVTAMTLDSPPQP